MTWQLQRVRGQLHHRETKTPGSDATLPLPDICATALKLRREQQAADRDRSGGAWIATGLVFTIRHGTPYEPGTSAATSPCAARRRVSAISRFTSPAAPAGHCWQRSTCTLAS